MHGKSHKKTEVALPLHVESSSLSSSAVGHLKEALDPGTRQAAEALAIGLP